MDKKEKDVMYFFNKLRAVMPFYGFSASVIQLLFLKYLQNFEDVKTPDQFKILLSYKNMFINKKFDKDVVNSVYKLVENKYKLEDNILTDSIDELSDLFKNKEEQIFNIINEFELSKDTSDIKELIKSILDFNENKDISKTSISLTNPTLVSLVSKILDVKDTETYMDVFSGFSRTSLSIDAYKYMGYETNKIIASTVNMIMILLDKKYFDFKNQNYYLSKTSKVADKIFADGQIKARLSVEEISILGNESKRKEYYTIKKVIKDLKDEGKAIITCSGNVLNDEEYISLRKEMTSPYLKAVISLPALWNCMSLSCNILLFDKSKKDDKVIMIDVSSDDFIYKVDRRTTYLKDESISLILDILNKKKIIDNVSNIISSKDILDKSDVSWSTSSYIIKNIKHKYRPSKEVEKDLKKKYEEISKLFGGE